MFYESIKSKKKLIFLAKALGAQRAGAGMYVVVHEDFEHCATPRFNKKVIF
jgi:hypothetical protein